MRRSAATTAVFLMAALALSACGGAQGTAPGPGAPRNGYGLLVDPRYGTPLPGGPPEF